MNHVMNNSINKHLIITLNCFGVVSWLGYGKGRERFSRFKCLRMQHKTVSLANPFPATYWFSGPDVGYHTLCHTVVTVGSRASYCEVY